MDIHIYLANNIIDIIPYGTVRYNIYGYIEVAFLLSGIQNHHISIVYVQLIIHNINKILKFEAYSSVFTAQTTGL